MSCLGKKRLLYPYPALPCLPVLSVSLSQSMRVFVSLVGSTNAVRTTIARNVQDWAREVAHVRL